MVYESSYWMTLLCFAMGFSFRGSSTIRSSHQLSAAIQNALKRSACLHVSKATAAGREKLGHPAAAVACCPKAGLLHSRVAENNVTV